MYDMKALYEAYSVEEAIKLRLEHPEAQIIAGGSDVLVQMREGKRAGKELISIYGLDELRGVSIDEEENIRIGSLSSFSHITRDPIIQKYINELAEKYDIREIAYDRWNASMMVQNLQDDGFTMVPFGQGFKDMSPPTKELMKLVLEQGIAHGGHPVLRWNMDNIFIRTDPAGNIKADKEKSTEKIDGAIATIMALDRAIRCGNEVTESVYDTRGLLVF